METQWQAYVVRIPSEAYWSILTSRHRTMARSFSATLDDAFLMNDTLDSLAQVITQK